MPNPFRITILLFPVLICLLLHPTLLSAQSTEFAGWPEISQSTRPWARWWWMGNAVDHPNIKSQLEQYAKAGLGGVEITPIYGAKGYEDQYLKYLSPKWMDALRYTVQIADSLGMAVDMSLGTGWPFGGPQVTPEYAASKLIVQTYDISSGEAMPTIVVDDSLQRALGATLMGITAYDEQGKAQIITEKVAEDGSLDWSPEAGDWKLYAIFSGKTRQQVKRAAPGGAGYTLDHLSEEALPVYLERFDNAFGENPPRIRSFFNDSYEVYNADFSPKLLEIFEQQQGYDVRKYLRELLTEEDSDISRRVKADYYETMGYMLLHNFTEPWSEWIHQHGALSRNQAHGSPGNLIDLYAAVDIPECETFGSTRFPIPNLPQYTNDTRNVEPDPVMMKFATSASNVLGKPFTSSETFTWLGEHFKVALSQAKPEVEQVFLAGVNHVFFHGTTYSPEQAGWPGWLFYASVNFAPSNSWWPHLNGLNDYIARCQSVLQAGRADGDALIYWPIQDVWYDAPLNKLDRQLTIHGIEEWLHPTPFYELTETLMDRGYQVDFVSDQLLDSLEVKESGLQTSDAASRYEALIIPPAHMMTVATFERILSLAEAGSTVIFQELPQDVPGFHQLEARRQQLNELKESIAWEDQDDGRQRATIGQGELWLTSNVEVALAEVGVQRESLVDRGLKFIRRQSDDGASYYLVNHTANAIDTSIPLQTQASYVTILNPQDGSQGLAVISTQDNTTSVRVALAPGEAWILKGSDEKPTNMADWPYFEPEGESIVLDEDWQLTFTQGGPELLSDQTLSQLTSWTELPDAKAARFSGTAEYQTTFTLDEKSADDYLLQLGDVRESARVWVNDQEVGILWSVPFQARIGEYLKEGENTIRVEVANLMANRIRDLDQRGITWRNYHEINFVNLEYQPFDASGWEPQPSGLLGPVQVTPLKKTRN
uniref:Glycosyl hydrolase n=1 Tax=Roseihalotalea indica TaxID=2867963 RepID=A0AA49GR77_9BACT|nr:glycosyl hydrolase [Tunicatimonas sp. TK19036]